MTNQDKVDGDAQRTGQGTSVIEWLAAAVGGAVFLTMVGYMSFVGLNAAEDAPMIKITSSPSVRQDKTYLVEFEAENAGDRTASGLVVKATLLQGESEIETSEVTIDYLPGRSVRSGGFFFKHDPKAYELELVPVGYLDP